MTFAATQVLTTVNAPYGAGVSAHQLAVMIADLKSATDFSGPVFAFFSEVTPELQQEFIKDMAVDQKKASKVADMLSKASGYHLQLAA